MKFKNSLLEKDLSNLEEEIECLAPFDRCNFRYPPPASDACRKCAASSLDRSAAASFLDKFVTTETVWSMSRTKDAFVHSRSVKSEAVGERKKKVRTGIGH